MIVSAKIFRNIIYLKRLGPFRALKIYLTLTISFGSKENDIEPFSGFIKDIVEFIKKFYIEI